MLHPNGQAAAERLYRPVQSTVRNEWLGINIFHSIREVQDYTTQWLSTYNNDRPNLGIDCLTPAMKLSQCKMAA